MTPRGWIDKVSNEMQEESLDSLSSEAMDVLESMVYFCLNNQIAMGMDGGYEEDGTKKPFRKEIEEAFNYDP